MACSLSFGGTLTSVATLFGATPLIKMDQNGCINSTLNVPIMYHDVRNGGIKVNESKPVTALLFLFDLSFFRTWSSSTSGNLIAGGCPVDDQGHQKHSMCSKFTTVVKLGSHKQKIIKKSLYKYPEHIQTGT